VSLFILSGHELGDFIVPLTPPLDDAVAANFERFDGLSELENFDAHLTQQGWLNYEGKGTGPRPGAGGSPEADIVYTPGPHTGITDVVGGQPLPVAAWQPTGGKADSSRSFTRGKTFRSPQFRLGKNGLGGQAYQGVEQTLQLSEITNNMPVPGELASIVAGV